MTKVLVTGSTGWLGRHLVPMLHAEGIETVGLDISTGEFTDVVGSIADRSLVDKLFCQHEFHGVIHAAALHKPDIVRYPQQAFVDTNITGTLNLLEAASSGRKIPFVYTSTTSLMISQETRDERGEKAVWLDERSGPLEPRNIYGVTKLAAEGLCRQHHLDRELPVIILRTSRFFPEEDDTLSGMSGPNLKANELLNRRATVEDMARAHVVAFKKAPSVGFGLYIVSAPTPFARQDVSALMEDARSVICRYFPKAESLYAKKQWSLPSTIGRVYDGSRIIKELGFRYTTSFSEVLDAIQNNTPIPLQHDPDYISPAQRSSKLEE